MRLLSLNCWGLRKPQAVSSLRRLFWGCKSSVAFLSETKLSCSKMKDLVKKLDDYDRIYVKSRGHSGSLPMLWKKCLQVTLLSCLSNHMDLWIQWDQNCPNGGLPEYTATPKHSISSKLVMCFWTSSFIRTFPGSLEEILTKFNVTSKSKKAPRSLKQF